MAKSLGDFANDIENTVFLSCGPPILSNIVEKIWRTKYNVKPENMFRFWSQSMYLYLYHKKNHLWIYFLLKCY